MNLTCDRTELFIAIQAVRAAIPTRPQFAVLRCVLLASKPDGNLEVTADNQEVRASASISATVKTPGTAAVPAHVLGEIVGPLQGDKVSLQSAAKGFQLSLKCAGFNCVIAGEDPATYPRGSAPTRSFRCTVAGDDLVHAIEQVRFAAAHEESRPALTGVLFRSDGKLLAIVATDGNRLAERRLEVANLEGTANALVSARPLGMLSGLLHRGSKMATVSIVGPDRDLDFGAERGKLSVRLMQNAYPDYSRWTTQGATTQVRVLIAPLLADLQSIATFAEGEARRIELRVDTDKISLKAAGAATGHGQASIAAHVSGQPIRATLNVGYLIDALRALDDLEAIVSFAGPNQPITVRPSGGALHVNVVLPIHSSAARGRPSSD